MTTVEYKLEIIYFTFMNWYTFELFFVLRKHQGTRMYRWIQEYNVLKKVNLMMLPIETWFLLFFAILQVIFVCEPNAIIVTTTASYVTSHEQCEAEPPGDWPRHNIDILMVPKLTTTATPGPGVLLTDLKLPPTLPGQVLCLTQLRWT